MSEINTTNMDREQLESTAADLGLNFRKNTPDDTLRSKIDEALGGTAGAAVAESEPDPDAEQDRVADQRKFEIIIATHEQDKQPVPVGVNGKTWLIKRGEKVIVPESVVRVLETAVQHQYDPKTMERADVLSYPFQITREV